ncbi:DMT family transporter [Limibacter armeniacum]|uniref:DMT family transporter n=1 Tax=Limibacter armeniacum TaxID=466084 RepID=UPI002FE6B00D
MNWIFYTASIIIGGLLATQVSINNAIKQDLGHPLMAAITNFTVGVICLLIFTFGSGNSQYLSNFGSIGEISWWKFLGGMLGAIFVTSSVIIGPKIGLAAFFTLIIAGQLIIGMLYDHIGFLGLPEQSISIQKVIGGCLLVAGAYMMNR